MKLHIGCKGPAIPGFKKVDIVQWGDVDYVRDARDLSCFETGSVDEIYASHILEHFPKHETVPVLAEWCRVLQPGGLIYISVPNFDVMVEMYIRSGRILETWVEHLVNGDQSSPQDFHFRVFTFPTLSGNMMKAGFADVKKLAELPYNVNDASHFRDSRFGLPISINVQGRK